MTDSKMVRLSDIAVAMERPLNSVKTWWGISSFQLNRFKIFNPDTCRKDFLVFDVDQVQKCLARSLPWWDSTNEETLDTLSFYDDSSRLQNGANG